MREYSVSAHALKQAARDGEEEGGGEGHSVVKNAAWVLRPDLELIKIAIFGVELRSVLLSIGHYLLSASHPAQPTLEYRFNLPARTGPHRTASPRRSPRHCGVK